MSIETDPATLFPFSEYKVTVNAHFFSLNLLSSKYRFEFISNCSLKFATFK